MTVTTEYGKQNMFATEPPIEVTTMNDNAELQNGRWAMIGIVATSTLKQSLANVTTSNSLSSFCNKAVT